MTLLFFVLGLVFGYVALALGLLGLIEALVVLGFALWQVRRFPERSGAYLVGLSLLPVILLTIIVTRVPVCSGRVTSDCYAPIATPALGAFAIAGLVGAILLGTTLRTMFATPAAKTLPSQGDEARLATPAVKTHPGQGDEIGR